MNTEEQPILYHCDECETVVKGHDRFCHSCGAYLGYSAEQVSIFNNVHLRSAFLFYVINLVICIVVKSKEGWFESYDTLFWIELLLATIAFTFAYFNRQSIKAILKFNNFKPLVVVVLVLIAAVFAFVVNISVRELNVSFFRYDISLYKAYDMYEFPVLIMIYSIALMPALFEELAFRGVLFGYLDQFLDGRLVVMITGFAFAAIHLNYISLVWLIPFGVLLGHLRNKYNTIWYGVIFHFVFNLTGCIIDLYREGMLW